MDLELFQKNMPGMLVPIAGSTVGAGPWEHHGFLPNPLGQTEPELSAASYRKVAQARAELAALDATAQRLPNPRLFRHSALRLEAQSTSALEGTYEPLSLVLASDPSETNNPSLREVLNFIKVAEAAFAWTEEGRPWTVGGLAYLQRDLLVGTNSERAHVGLRTTQVVIGQRSDVDPSMHPIHAARFVPGPPGPDLDARVRDLLRWMTANHGSQIDPVVQAALVHYTFETLHPFHDGNGRLGRLLIIIQLHQQGILSEPTLTVSPWFEARRTAYYDSLMTVSTEGAWSRWVGFFADGLAQSARDTRARMTELVTVQSELTEIVRKSTLRSPNARTLVDFAVARPSFTVTQAAEHLGMRYQGAHRLIESLQGLGVLAAYDDRAYDRRYQAPRVIEVLLRHR